jgi:nucleoside-diphosphate-sugar epimerase
MTQTNRGHVLITGASGFTGHHMVAEAVKAGFSVRATDISSRFYGGMFEALGVEFVSADLTRREGLDALLRGVDSVIHVAGIHNYSTPDKVIFAVNTQAVENICDAAIRSGVERFMHFSSVGVYGYSSNPGNPVKEDDPKVTPPLNNYNVSKWEGEKIIHKYIREKGLPATIFRPGAIYGSRSEYGLYLVFKMTYDERRKKKKLILGKGDKIEAFLHVEDMCRAVIHAYDKDEMIGEAYNIADDTHVTSAEFYKLVNRELFGVEKGFFHLPLPVAKVVAYISQFTARCLNTKPLLEKATLDYANCDKIWDNSKLKATGFEFKYPTMEKGIRETLQWYKDNGWFRV